MSNPVYEMLQVRSSYCLHCYFSSFFEHIEEPAITDSLIFVILEILEDGAAQEVATGKVSLF